MRVLHVTDTFLPKIGGAEKGRESARQPEKLRSLVASLEGMNRFALAMGLITPAEGRELYASHWSFPLHVYVADGQL